MLVAVARIDEFVGGTDAEGRKKKRKKNHPIHYYIASRYNNTGVISSCNIAIWQRMSNSNNHNTRRDEIRRKKKNNQ